MAKTLPVEDFKMNYEEIRIDYSRAAPDTFDFTTPKERPDPDWHGGWDDVDALAAPDVDLSDEMPEDLPAGLVVYHDFDFVFDF